MEKHRLGTSTVSVSQIGLGTWAMAGNSQAQDAQALGRPFWGDADDYESIRVIRHALDLGVTLVDTAETYGDGHAEEVIGRALAGRRDHAVIASKVAPGNLEVHRLSQALAGSCERLRTDYIDIYFIHWPNPDIPIGPTMEELERLRAQGRIRAIGVSNFNVRDLELAQPYGTIDVLQPPYNMFWREIEAETLSYCRANEIGVIAYSGLAQGLLTGTLTHDTVFADGDQRPTTVLFRPGHYQLALDAVEKMRPLARKYDKTMAQLAIRWLTSRPGVDSALVGPRTVAEMDENSGGVGWRIHEDDLALIDDATRVVWDQVSPHEDMFGRYESAGSPRLPGP